jgi:hypothetical protein
MTSTTVGHNMNMQEALEWAADYAQRNKLFEVPTNSRGYPADGAKSPTPAEKTEVIMHLAGQALVDPTTALKQTASWNEVIVLADNLSTLADIMADGVLKARVETIAKKLKHLAGEKDD